MFSGIDAIVLAGGAVLLGISLTTALLALRRSSRKEHRKAQDVTAAAAAAQLQEWRNAKILVMSDEDFRLALQFEKHSPGQLRRLVGAIQRIIDEEDLEPDDYISLTVQVEYDAETENEQSSDARSGHLELTAHFA